MGQSRCKLCGQLSELQRSHIIPQFVFDWMKKTGTRYLRSATQPNVRAQDGTTRPILCRECEQILSKSEGWFSREIFYPYVEGTRTVFEYGPELMHFCVSVLWRVAVLGIDSFLRDHVRFTEVARAVEGEWRSYLLGAGALKTFNRNHLFFTSLGASPSQPVDNLNRYLTRHTDGTIAFSKDECFVYSKFARFILIGEVTELTGGDLIGTLVTDGSGTIGPPQQLENGHIGNFMAQRAAGANEMYERGLSQRQREKIAATYEGKGKELAQTDYGRAHIADVQAVVDPTLIRSGRVGRNELCPCGSGKKYKRCHGA